MQTHWLHPILVTSLVFFNGHKMNEHRVGEYITMNIRMYTGQQCTCYINLFIYSFGACTLLAMVLYQRPKIIQCSEVRLFLAGTRE